MELHVPSERVPIQTDADGVIRVGGTRITLDTVVAAFDAGATAEGSSSSTPRSTWRMCTPSSPTTCVTSRRSGRTSYNGSDKLRRFARRTSAASILPACAITS